MKNLLITLLLGCFAFIGKSQTLGEIRVDTTIDDVFVGYNSFLQRQPVLDRVSYYSNNFKQNPNVTLQFFSVMNVSRDTVEYYDGGTTVHYLPPWSAITGEAIFEESGLLVAGPQFVWVVDSKTTKGLFIVERKCKNCHYYREAIGQNYETNSEQIALVGRDIGTNRLSVSGLRSNSFYKQKADSRRLNRWLEPNARQSVYPNFSLFAHQ